MYYLNSRFYHPSLRRFLTIDDFNYLDQKKSVTFNTGVTGYSNGIASVDLISIASGGGTSGSGLYASTKVDVSTGKVTFYLTDSSGAIIGFHGTLVCKYVFWK